MIEYVITDEAGFVTSVGYGASIPPAGIEGTLLSAEAPTPYHKYHWITKEWVDSRTLQDYLRANRIKRNNLLLVSDWTQLPDAPLFNKESWVIYRQSLRDITLRENQINITWPQEPKG